MRRTPRILAAALAVAGLTLAALRLDDDDADDARRAAPTSAAAPTR